MPPVTSANIRKRAISAFALVALCTALLSPFGTRAATGDVTLPLCTQADHDRYKVQGPDGQMYDSWHPQIDGEKNCHFDHEHGSNPALLGPVTWLYGSSLVPLYGYTASHHMMSEGHAGFKTYIFRLSGYTFMI